MFFTHSLRSITTNVTKRFKMSRILLYNSYRKKWVLLGLTVRTWTRSGDSHWCNSITKFKANKKKVLSLTKSSEIRANVLADMWLVPKVNFEKYLCSIYVAPMLQKPLLKELMKNEVWRKFDWRTEKILEHPISVDSPTLNSIRHR